MSEAQIIAQKQDIIDQQEAIIAQKDILIAENNAQIASLKYRLAQLEKLIYGSKSEKYKSLIAQDQLSLFDTTEPSEDQPEPTEQISYDRKKKKQHPGRNPLPQHLPVEEVVIEPTEDTTDMVKIGEQITETLAYTPASLIKKRTIRPKYADKTTDTIYIAQLPNRPLPKAIAEASLLSHIMVSKYVDHLPLYRQAGMFKRDFEWEVSQNTMNDWIRGSCDLLQPLYQAMIKKILSTGYLQADESPLKVLEYAEQSAKSPPKKIMQGYQWVYYSPELKMVYFNYRKGRGKNGPKEVLANYKGYVQCDGYAVYDHVAKLNPHITLVGCLCHARRKFVEAQDNDAKRSQYAIDIIGKIYKIERQIKDLSPEQGLKVRQEQTLPLLQQIKDWIEEQSIQVLPQSPIGKAMYYYQAQWEKLKQVAQDARLQLDNNLIENKIRPLALGRKNYLFAGSHQGAQRIAMMYTFFGTCKANDINPRDWLKTTLEKISDHPINRIHELIPGYQGEKV